MGAWDCEQETQWSRAQAAKLMVICYVEGGKECVRWDEGEDVWVKFSKNLITLIKVFRIVIYTAIYTA